MKYARRIFIVGHHGAGKGLLAKTVAQSLGWQFVDADIGLESHIGRHLHDILGERGQADFYDCQFDILKSLCSQENIVVATDASVACSEKNRELLRHEMTVWLDVSTPIQIERTLRHAAYLLPISNVSDFFERLHEERDGLFKEVATLTIQGDNGELEEHSNSIIKAILGDERPTPNLKASLEQKDLILLHKQWHTPVHLSEHQAIYLKLLAQGKSAKEIARKMDVSYRTVEGTIAKLMESLGCTSSKELIALYHHKP